LGYQWTDFKNRIVVQDQDLANYLAPFSGSHQQRMLPAWVFDLNATQSETLLKALILENGTFDRNWLLYTTSERLANDIQRLCLHAGFAGDIESSVMTSGKKSCKVWQITVVDTYDSGIIKQNEATLEDYESPVFCLQVPSEVFYVRRNGKGVWTGNSRSRGPRTMLTRQPPEGRSRDGGLRFGEMERDCIISHGMGRFLKERMLETADAYSCHVCQTCGLFAQRMLRQDNKPYATKRDIFYCAACKNKTNIAKIRIPYAFKLLIQEMMSMNIAARIRVNENQYTN
jgi:hypothetical protein